MSQDRKDQETLTDLLKQWLQSETSDEGAIHQATLTPRPIEQVLENETLQDAIRKSSLVIRRPDLDAFIRGGSDGPTIEDLKENVVSRIKMILQKDNDNLPITAFYAHERDVTRMIEQKLERLAETKDLTELPIEEREKATDAILNEAFVYLLRDSQIIHESAVVADLHAHPGLKAAWFGRNLTEKHEEKNWLQRVFGLRAVDFDPTAVRTDFFQLRRGKVNVLFSAVYAFELEALYNFRITGIPLMPRNIRSIEGARKLPGNRIKLLIGMMVLSVLLKYGLVAWATFDLYLLTPFAIMDAIKLVAGVGLFFVFDNALQRRARLPERPLILLLIINAVLFISSIVLLTWFGLLVLEMLPILLFEAAFAALSVLIGVAVLFQIRIFLPYISKHVLNRSAFESSMAAIKMVDKAVKRNTDGDVRSVQSVDDLKAGLGAVEAAKHARGHVDSGLTVDEPLMIIHSLEGAHCLHGDDIVAHLALTEAAAYRRDPESKYELDRQLQSDIKHENEAFRNLTQFYQAGVALMGLSHYYPNIVCQSTFSFPERIAGHIDEQYWPENWHNLTLGLTPVGKRIVTEMIRIGMMIDLAHTSPATRRDIYQLASQLKTQYGWQTTIVASHIGVQKLHAHPYNLADWEIVWLARNNGLIGVMWSNFWLTGHEGLKLGSGYIVQTVNYIVDLLKQHDIPNCEAVIGFGSDLDGLSDPPDDLWNASRWPILTEVLTAQYEYDGDRDVIRYRYSPDALRCFLGGNTVNAALRGWGRKQSDPEWNLKMQLGSVNNAVAKDAAAGLLAQGITDLGDISLKGANLEGIDFAPFTFESVNLQEANMARVTGMTVEKLSKATSLEGCILPDSTKMPGRSIEAYMLNREEANWRLAFAEWVKGHAG